MTYEEILAELESMPKKKMSVKEEDFVERYLGTRKKVLAIKTNELVRLAKKVAKLQNDLKISDLQNLLDKLFSGQTIEEHIVGGKIFMLLTPENRLKINGLEKWFAKTHGWLEIDVICQSTYTGREVEENWAWWENMIKDFSKSSNIQVRRASLVLQNKPIKESNDLRLRKLAFEIIEKLKLEKEVLITKAISWLLRSLVINDKEEVRNYIKDNLETLPKIAVRETMKKIETGKK